MLNFNQLKKYKRVLVCVAHPDDETFAAIGTLQKFVQHGSEVRLLCATNGEKGKAHILNPPAESELGTLRQNELRAALICAGLGSSRLRFLEFPDTGVTEHALEIKELVFAHVRDYSPDLLVSFDETGLSGHLDHIAIGTFMRQVAERQFIDIMTFALPPTMVQYAERMLARRKHGVYTKKLHFAKPNMRIAINREMKLQAMRCHDSQWGSENPLETFPPEIAKSILEYEYFVFQPARH